MLDRIDKNALAARIHQERPYVNEKAAMNIAEELIQAIDERLEENVLEWMMDQPLSPVVCVGKNGKAYTLAAILERYSGHDFISALECMNLFYTDPDKAAACVRRIYR